MTNAKPDGRNPDQFRNPESDPGWSNGDMNELLFAQQSGIEQASREIVQTTLRFWALRGNDPNDEIVRFLAHMTKEVITGEIRANPEIPF